MSSLQVHMEREAREHKRRAAHLAEESHETRVKEIAAWVGNELALAATPTRNPAHRADTGDDRLAQFQSDPEGRALVAGIHERKKAKTNND